jgi:hypothetical protein
MSQTDSVFIGMKAAARAAAVASGVLGERGEIDPVFPLIEQHTIDEFHVQIFLSESSERENLTDEANTWSENAQASLHELIETPPTTLAGAIALLAHIQNSSANESMNQSEWLELLSSLQEGLRTIAQKQGQPASGTHAGPSI